MFHKCNTLEEGKKLYRALALRLHPDQGGTDDLMILLKDAFSIFEKKHEKSKDQVNTNSNYTYDDLKNAFYSHKNFTRPSYQEDSYEEHSEKIKLKIWARNYIKHKNECLKKYVLNSSFINKGDPRLGVIEDIRLYLYKMDLRQQKITLNLFDSQLESSDMLTKHSYEKLVLWLKQIIKDLEAL